MRLSTSRAVPQSPRRRAAPAPPGARLAAAAALVPHGATVADVGTDAAALALWLVESGTAARCIATDRSAAGLAAARLRGSEHVAAGRLELRRGAGLAPLAPADALDVLVLCGLGARTIVRILGEPGLERLGLSRLVLQPQTEPARLRRFLLDRGHAIVAEVLVRERGHDYVVLAAEPCRGARPRAAHAADAEVLAEAGPCLAASSDPLVAEHWRRELERQQRILERGATGAGRARAQRRLALARRVLRRLNRNRVTPIECPRR